MCFFSKLPVKVLVLSTGRCHSRVATENSWQVLRYRLENFHTKLASVICHIESLIALRDL